MPLSVSYLYQLLNSFLSIKLWDYDFWWHLSTGKYIAENKIIPAQDPFSFPNNLSENKNLFPEREKFIIKQYWLAQVLFYEIYSRFHDMGIIVLRSLLLFLVIISAFWWFRRNKIAFYITYPFLFFIFYQIATYSGERPVLFTFLFTVITFIILDDFKQRKSKLIFFLIPLMLLWANLHGGYIIGVIIILTFIAGETLRFILKRSGTDKRAFITLCIVGLIAIAVSGINPNGFNIVYLFSDQKIFEQGTQEYFSPFTLYKSKIRAIDFEYIVLILLLPVLLVLRNRKTDIVYYILLFGFLYMSVTALRYLIFYVLISAMILAREYHLLIEDLFAKININKAKFNLAVSSLILISSILFAGGFLDMKRITFAKAEMVSVPKGAADFIILNNIEGNMFNDMGFGGYLIWRFYPWKKVFVDTRQLNHTVVKEYEWIMFSRESIKSANLPKEKNLSGKGFSITT